MRYMFYEGKMETVMIKNFGHCKSSGYISVPEKSTVQIRSWYIQHLVANMISEKDQNQF